MSLRKPVRVRADASFEVAPRLVQEFVRVRSTAEEHRHAILLALVSRTFKHKTIIFCATKVRTAPQLAAAGTSSQLSWLSSKQFASIGRGYGLL